MTSLCRRWGLFAVVCGLAACPSTTPPDAGFDAGCSACNLVGCAIDGVIYGGGAANPAAVCQVCAPHSSMSGWTNVLDGTLCDAGSVCASGQCLPGCFIDGFYEAADGGDPNDSCELCNPALSLSSWTVVGADGSPCTGDSGNFCLSGACVSECVISGATDGGDAGVSFVAAGTANPLQSCLSCQPSLDPNGWSASPDATDCDQDGGNLCLGGVCVAGCFIDGGVEPAGAPNAENGCFGCQPQQSPLADTQLPDGTPCSTDGTVCQGGACVSGCVIGGVFYSDGTLDGGAALSGGAAGNPNVCCRASVSATSWSPGFGAATSVPTGVEPEVIAIGDVNDDGIPDLVVAHPGLGDIGILLGQDGGTFEAEQLIPVGLGPRALALADLNGDGLTDIAVINGGGSTLVVMLQQGDGGWAEGLGTPFVTPLGPTGIAAIDVNDDKLPDLVVSDDGNGGQVTVWLANPDGGFAPPQSYNVGQQPVGLVTAYFESVDVTYSPDVVTVDIGDDTLTILHNPGDGNFTSTPTTIALPVAPSALAAGDFNGDGYPDLAVAGQGPDGGVVAVYLNRAVSPWFVSPVLFAVDGFPSALAAADLNGDGLVDLAVTSQRSGVVEVLANLTAPRSGLPVFLPPASYAVGKQPTAVAVAKLQGNANPDIAVANVGSSSVSVLSGNCP